MANANDAGVEALKRLKATEPPSWLVPNPSLSETTRAASQYLFSSLRPFSQKSPLDELLVDGFDAEQIWQQIDLQSQPLIPTLRRRLKHITKNPEEICQLKVPSEVANKAEGKNRDEWNEESDGFDEELDEADEDEDEEGVEKEEKGGSEEEGSEDEDEEGKGSEEEKGEGGGIEDKFLKIGELNEYLQNEEDKFENDEKGDDEDQDTEEDEESDDDGEFDMEDGDEEDEEADGKGNARYLLFSSYKRTGAKRFEPPFIPSLQLDQFLYN